MIKLKRLVFLIVLLNATFAISANVGTLEDVVQVAGPVGTLKGVLKEPLSGTDSTAVVIIIPGSGPTDHNGNGPLGLKSSSYQYIADGLAAQGLTSIRIDKRGMFSSADIAVNPNKVTINDYASDVNSWVKFATRTTNHQCAWLLGHSEGALIAEVTAQANKNICGLILVAGPGRRLSDILRDQIKSNPANQPIMRQAFEAIDQLETGKGVDTSDFHPALARLFRPEVQGLLISEFAVDPSELLKQCQIPVLIIQGTNDLQIGVQDADRLRHACPSASIEIIEHMNHVLKIVPDGDRSANIASYSDPNLPLADQVVPGIAKFVKANSNLSNLPGR